MTAVEIEQAVAALVESPFDPAEFPFQLLQAFGNKETTLKRLRAGDTIHLFTDTLERMTERDGCNTALVPSGLFQAMNAAPKDRPASPLRPWALRFEYVNGNLFSGSTQTRRFSKIARSYLLGCGRDLNWKLINPDIFGSMI